jgi:hypothetical protein
VALPRVNGGRRAEKVIAAEWAQEWPNILGGLLTLAAAVHHRLPSVTVTDLPRMADYANVLEAVDQMCGTDGLQRYREQAKRAAADTLDNSFIGALIAEHRSHENATSKEILTDLKPTEPGWKPPKDWPTNARAATGQLTRHAPALRAQGWYVENDDGRNKRNRAQWTIRPPEKACDPDSPNSPALLGDDNNSSDGMSGGETDGYSTAAGDSPDSPDNSPDNSPDSLDSPDSPFDTPPTSEDELASQASQKCSPSLVACRKCGDPIPEHMHSMRERRVCSRCTAKAVSKQAGAR